MTGFHVYRATKPNGKYKVLNKKLRPAKNIGGITGAKYVYLNKKFKRDKTYFYKLEIVQADGTSAWSEIVKVKIAK